MNIKPKVRSNIVTKGERVVKTLQEETFAKDSISLVEKGGHYFIKEGNAYRGIDDKYDLAALDIIEIDRKGV